MKRFVAISLLLSLAPIPVFAGKVKTVTISTPSNYDKARLEQTVVSSEGAVRLARSLKPLATNEAIDAARVWDIVEDRAGNLYVATGDDGKIFKISLDGKVSLAFESGDSQVLCLVASPNGSIYAGTGPGGRIVRIAPIGKSKHLDQRHGELCLGSAAQTRRVKTCMPQLVLAAPSTGLTQMGRPSCSSSQSRITFSAWLVRPTERFMPEPIDRGWCTVSMRRAGVTYCSRRFRPKSHAFS